jgi:hypothetical protein
VLCSYLRQRENLVAAAAMCVQHMQKRGTVRNHDEVTPSSCIGLPVGYSRFIDESLHPSLERIQ